MAVVSDVVADAASPEVSVLSTNSQPTANVRPVRTRRGVILEADADKGGRRNKEINKQKAMEKEKESKAKEKESKAKEKINKSKEKENKAKVKENKDKDKIKATSASKMVSKGPASGQDGLVARAAAAAGIIELSGQSLPYSLGEQKFP